MKLKISLLTIVILITGLFLTSCISSSKSKTIEDYTDQHFKSTISTPGQETAFAQKETYSDFEKFIKEAYIKIGQNEINISEMKKSISIGKNDSCNIDLALFDKIEKSNVTIKLELDNYVQNGNGNWQSFKTNFYTGLNEIDTALNNVVAKNI